jgi:hypothetical protein
VSFAAITFCAASQRVFIFVSICFVIDSVRKLLDTPTYTDRVPDLGKPIAVLLVRESQHCENQ